jgi:transcriptional regulator with XRE-family HTH domain
VGGLRKRDKAFAQVFGANLVRYREGLGISQENLGLMAGLHRTAVGQLERGERIARTDTLVRMAGSLGVGPEALLAGLCWRPAQIEEGSLQIERTDPDVTSQPKESNRATSRIKDRSPASQKASNESVH